MSEVERARAAHAADLAWARKERSVDMLKCPSLGDEAFMYRQGDNQMGCEVFLVIAMPTLARVGLHG